MCIQITPVPGKLRPLRRTLQRCNFPSADTQNLTIENLLRYWGRRKFGTSHNMSTTTATQTTPAVIVAPKALVAGIKELLSVQSKLEGKFHTLAEMARKAAHDLTYTEAQAREMITLAYQEAGQDITLKAPDISKIHRLAFPRQAAIPNVAAAQEHNATAAPSDRIGVNDLLRIARDKEGQTTVQTILDERQSKRDSKARPQGNASPSASTASTASTTPSKALSPEDAQESLGNALAAAINTAKRNGLSEEQITDAFDTWLAAAFAPEGESATH
jgi:hypothetical protein